LGLTFITLGLVFALSGFLFRHSFLGEHTTFILRVGGAVIILVGFFEFFRRGHRFAMTESGFDDQSYGGIGAVAWCEVSRFRVEKSLRAGGLAGLLAATTVNLAGPSLADFPDAQAFGRGALAGDCGLAGGRRGVHVPATFPRQRLNRAKLPLAIG
jgi:hypothetical protein